ncbi:hypothetical protein DUI87_10834 [Hirundo rustica rustica]|uniref:Cytochrome b5 reductase 4 n=1 Tax=Hirundo rustica rustica TaxID=333673 RepID=A0A3M0KJ68_HIRRU|nr:hypothetical protein DUI87_10834 [Hirundo rustica rustica]
MLNVTPPAFPAPGSQQRAAAGARSKVPLKPGRSLMDWIRLTKSGKDLTGLKGRLIEVTEDELSKHNKKEDCWICIRGFVYNVTPYMEYHPGGEDELMKAAGTDGTDLFDQVHRWVNYESMLKECLVGRMAVKPIAAPKEVSSVSEDKKQLNGVLLEKKVQAASAKDLSPSYDWFQTDSLITIVIYTKQKDMNAELVIVDCQDKQLRGEIIMDDHSYLVEVGLFYRKCKLVSKTEVTHDTKLFCLMLPKGTHLRVPTGQHVYLKQIIAGDCISVSNPEGNFKKSQVQASEDLLLLAGGTGFTPMVKLLNFALTEVSCLRTVKLIFFNKTEDDILWRNQLEQLALKDERKLASKVYMISYSYVRVLGNSQELDQPSQAVILGPGARVQCTIGLSGYSGFPLSRVRVKKDKYETDQSGPEMGCSQEKAEEVKMCQDTSFYQLVLHRIIKWFALEGTLKII